MNTRTIFYVGTGYNRNGEAIAEPTLSLALASIRDMLAREYGGFTESDSVGGWDDGISTVTESAKRFEAMDGEGKAGWSLPQAIHKARTIAARIAAMLDQSAVLFTAEEIHMEFVTAEVPVEA